MPSGITFSGLASGLDTAKMLDQLMAIERRPIELLLRRQSGFRERLAAWQKIDSQLLSLKNAAAAIRKATDFNLFNATSDDDEVLAVRATTAASPGTHTVDVLALAKARKLSSKPYTDSTTALNLSGEIVINGKAVQISSSYSLADVRDVINNAKVGVTASILSISEADYRLVLTSDTTGAEGFDILDASSGSSNLLQSLGFTDSTTSIKNPLSNGAKTNAFSSSTATIAGLLGLTSPQSGTIQINGVNVTLNLATDSLTSIKTAIDNAAIPGVTTNIATETVDGQTQYRLEINNGTSYTDSNNLLETLGILVGGTGKVAEVKTGTVANTTNGSSPITANTTFANIFGAGVANGDTITISGTDHNGNAVSSTFTISNKNTTKVQDLLNAIQTAFSNTVTATVDSSGKLVITDNTAGTSQLTVSLTENNQGGGKLDFGFLLTTTAGRERETQAGQDAQVRVDGVTLTRSSNSISDVIEGVSLDLLKVETTKTINVAITRDLEAVKSKIGSFVKEYNAIVDAINAQFKYDADQKKAGVLSGEGTLRSVQSEIRNIVFGDVLGLPSTLNALGQIGVKSDKYGKLSVDDKVLSEKLQSDFQGVRRIFIGEGTTTDADIVYLSHTKKTKAGTYSVVITTAAAQATVTGTTNLSGGLGGNETLTITDAVTGRIATISLAQGDSLATIVSKINTELAQEYAQELTGSVAVTSGGSPATANTLFSALDAGVQVGDTITISGTTHGGKSVSGSYTVTSGATLQDFLTKIQDVFGGEVTATINAAGKLVVTDHRVGESSLTLSLTENNEGGGILDFGTLDETTKGRYGIEITASSSGGYLTITHNSYGSAFGFTVSQTSNYTGIANGSYVGVDVAGTINGETATGSGQTLTGNSGNTTTDGLALQVKLTAAQLASQGSAQGTVKLTLGVAEQMNFHLEFITDKYSGYVTKREEAIQDTIDDLQDRIDLMEKRVEERRRQLQERFVRMEQALQAMNSLSSYLNSQLGTLNRI